MRKFFVLFLFSFFVKNSILSQHKIDTIRTYIDSINSIECTYKNNILHGYCISFYQNGKIKEIDSIDNGVTIKSLRYSEDGKILRSYYYDGKKSVFVEHNLNGNLVNKGFESWRKTKIKNWYENGNLSYNHKSKKGYEIVCDTWLDSIIPDSVIVQNGWCFWNNQRVYWKKGECVDSNGNILNKKYSSKTITYYENGKKAQMWKKKKRNKKTYFKSWDINGVLTEKKYI